MSITSCSRQSVAVAACLARVALVSLLIGCGQHTSKDTEENGEPTSRAEVTVDHSDGSDHQVGVLYWSMNIPGQVAMRKGLEQQAEALNAESVERGLPQIELIARVAGDDTQGMARQIEQMEELIALDVDILIVQPTDNAALAGPLRLANDKQIPVVAYDQSILGGKVHSFLTSNNYQAGFLDGEYVAANFSNARTLRVILVEYPHVSSTVERQNGFLQALESYEQPYKIVATYRAVEPESGRQAGKDILKDFPKPGSVDVIFACNDGGGVSLVKVLEDANRTDLFVATVDGDPVAVEMIRKGSILRIDSAQFCGALGRETMKVAHKLLQGESVPEHILIPTFPITKETVHRYGGWLKPVPEPFEKPWASSSPTWSFEILSKDPKEPGT